MRRSNRAKSLKPNFTYTPTVTTLERMTIKEAEENGYRVVAASPFEVGLIHNGRGIRTWFCNDFYRTLPPLDHPKIQEAIAVNEALLHEPVYPSDSMNEFMDYVTGCIVVNHPPVKPRP